jgi:hypothetical protein
MGVVPVPEALRHLSQDPQFWVSLLADDGPDIDQPARHRTVVPGPDEATPGPDALRLNLPVAGGYGLVLDLDLRRGDRRLGVRGPATSEPVQLGWAAPGRPYPAVLAFPELELCARVIALDEPGLPHPGLVVALLSRFAPAGPGDDPAEVATVLQAAFRSLRRDVPVVEARGPEQDPLPYFAGATWWPRPAVPPARVLDDGTIATFLLSAAPLLTAAPAGPDGRGGARFPAPDLTALVRAARARLSKLPREPWCAATGVLPLARRITADGDLTPVAELLGTLTETGCDHPTVLDALSEPLVPAEACWMVETLAGAEPGTLLRRHLVGAARLG